MLKITVGGKEYYDEEKEEFCNTKSYTLQLEHSLISISKWESKWKKPFLGEGKKSREETLDYVRCMTLNNDVPDDAYYMLSDYDIARIMMYIDDPMTATTFKKVGGPEEGMPPKKKQVITSEVLYYQMIAYGIPVEFQKWHLNRLITLIHVCNIKSAPPGSNKMSKKQTAQHYAAMNKAARNRSHK